MGVVFLRPCPTPVANRNPGTAFVLTCQQRGGGLGAGAPLIAGEAAWRAPGGQVGWPPGTQSPNQTHQLRHLCCPHRVWHYWKSAISKQPNDQRLQALRAVQLQMGYGYRQMLFDQTPACSYKQTCQAKTGWVKDGRLWSSTGWPCCCIPVTLQATSIATSTCSMTNAVPALSAASELCRCVSRQHAPMVRCLCLGRTLPAAAVRLVHYTAPGVPLFVVSCYLCMCCGSSQEVIPVRHAASQVQSLD